MKKILVVVDMQNDFLTGTLANESAVKIIPNIKKEIESDVYDIVVYTRDTHYANYPYTQEGQNLPVVHCVEGEWGHHICDELLFDALPENKTAFIINKPTFGYKDWGNQPFVDTPNGTDYEFTFTGTCTDICVVSNALAIKATFPEAKVKCLANCCAPLFGDPARQEAALTVMESCQVEVIR